MNVEQPEMVAEILEEWGKGEEIDYIVVTVGLARRAVRARLMCIGRRRDSGYW